VGNIPTRNIRLITSLGEKNSNLSMLMIFLANTFAPVSLHIIDAILDLVESQSISTSD
jgi:hypothetical protein